MAKKTKRSEAQLRLHADIFKALAHPSRLRILEALAGGKRCVNELTELVGSDMSTVSRHLSRMRAVGVIRDEKKGLQVFYELRCPCILRFLDCVEAVVKEQRQQSCSC